jgi:glyoxylase-like metal-dependent hydrolase (beta-lactamase superfamily II)
MEIIPGIHQVDGVNGNCYILVRDDLTVIDTGLAGSGKKILNYIKDKVHREPSEIKTIILTHFHMDHVGGVATLKAAAPGAQVAIGSGDEGYVNGTLPQPVHSGVKGQLLRIAAFIMRPGHFTPDVLLKDGDRISDLLCIAIPGHTPGSIGLLEESKKAFFSGDIFRSDGSTVSGGPLQFTMDQSRENESRKKIAALDFDLLLPGHGVPIRRGASEIVRNFLKNVCKDDI